MFLKMFSEKVTSIKALEKAAKKLVEQFSGQRIFAFYGKMGAGKTTFIQAICKVLGSADNVISPTFALINEYKTTELHSIFHFDFYRIESMEEAFDLGYEDYFYSGEYCLIEWPEKIEPLLPENFVEVKIEAQENEHRIITAQKV
jgi:tRNA threonylcarbamoyladenosine biosynthesis protein TsaE